MATITGIEVLDKDKDMSYVLILRWRVANSV
jgi:hypothetical protein